MDILLIDEEIKNNLNSVDKEFYILDSSHIIIKYKKLLTKKNLLPNLIYKREKINIIKEYKK